MKTIFFTCGIGLLMLSNGYGQGSFDEWVSKASAALDNFSSNSQGTGNNTNANADADKSGANEASTAGTNNTASKAKNPVGAALKKLQFASGHGAAKNLADYYIYVYSANWCGACRKQMPAIVKKYEEEIRAERKVELVLIALDKKPCISRAYMDNLRATFPGVWYKREGVSELPGSKIPRTIPTVTIVDKYGKVIETGDCKLVQDWKKLTIEKDK